MTEKPVRHTSYDFGRDGISGLVSRDRGIRAREVSQPDNKNFALAKDNLDNLLARTTHRRFTPRSDTK